MAISRTICFLQAFLLFCCHYNLVRSQTRDTYEFSLENGWSSCSHTTNATVSFQNNVHLLLSDFNQQSSTKAFYNTSVGHNLDKVFGYYLCRGDVSLEVCNECILNGTQSAAGFDCEFVDKSYTSGLCFFKYSNYNMYGLWPISITRIGFIEVNVTNYEQFNVTFTSLMEELINEAAFESQKNGSVLGFSTNEASVTGDQTIYGLAQCTPDIVGVNCSLCLQDALSGLRGLAEGAPAAYSVDEKCYLRYDNVSFYNLGE
ncbi:putative cysteine-rich receptor-like protein kinase 9 [Chenopodium quinoa]|uniref:putative cysteine-rich receptor-like protein kinase 9 n=1 Tax=Chenopodium quinoa TaxID=63459 RepID=UPI000B77F8FD|nr:putative cysteine-rich receptor-like protein kinase 9 [Chenopodium quinoa]